MDTLDPPRRFAQAREYELVEDLLDGDKVEPYRGRRRPKATAGTG
jgi:hypothetical protein